MLVTVVTPGVVIAVAPQIKKEMKSNALKRTVVGLNDDLREAHNRVGITRRMSQIASVCCNAPAFDPADSIEK